MTKIKNGFLFSMVGGILILINGAITAIGDVAFSSLFDFSVGLIESPDVAMSSATWMTILSLAFGIIVVIGSLVINKEGKERTGGLLVILFSVITILMVFVLNMPLYGFFAGPLIAIIGGLFGLAKR